MNTKQGLYKVEADLSTHRCRDDCPVFDFCNKRKGGEIVIPGMAPGRESKIQFTDMTSLIASFRKLLIETPTGKNKSQSQKE
ncbi:hypothetical protein [Terrimonas alba]|uniref:hypothetical protein n=1 Tax=Terrimonas alba TaxID=3349636 RepID=UPI0035F30CA0